MKIDLLIEKERPNWASRHPLSVRRAVPFVMKSTGRVHRIRSAQVHSTDRPDLYGGRRHWLSIHLWCGQGASPYRKGSRNDLMLHEPPDGALICGTCEGRAIGFGQPPSVSLVDPDHRLIFSPRT